MYRKTANRIRRIGHEKDLLCSERVRLEAWVGQCEDEFTVAEHPTKRSNDPWHRMILSPLAPIEESHHDERIGVAQMIWSKIGTKSRNIHPSRSDDAGFIIWVDQQICPKKK